MKLLAVSLAVLASLTSTVLAAEVKIDVTRAVECDRKSQKGDKISVHYRGTLEKDGSEFDASYKRGQPLSFVVGKGSVIKGYIFNWGSRGTAANNDVDGMTIFWICALGRREL